MESAIHTSPPLPSSPHLPLCLVSVLPPPLCLTLFSPSLFPLRPRIVRFHYSCLLSFMKLLFCSSDLRTESTVASSGRWWVWRVVSSSRFVRSHHLCLLACLAVSSTSAYLLFLLGRLFDFVLLCSPPSSARSGVVSTSFFCVVDGRWLSLAGRLVSYPCALRCTWTCDWLPAVTYGVNVSRTEAGVCPLIRGVTLLCCCIMPVERDPSPRSL